MTRVLRIISTAAGLGLMGSLLLVQPAEAAIVLDHDPPAAAPGTTVVATTVDESMSTIPSGRLQLFLAPSQQAANNATGPDDPILTSIGILSADEECVGRLSFTVPDLPAGRYVVMAHCAECRPNMVFPDTCNPDPGLAENATGPGTMFTVGRFEVSAAPLLPRTGFPAFTTAGVALLLSFLGSVVIIAARRRSSKRSAETDVVRISER